MLTALGASDAEDRVYRCLLGTVSATGTEIAAATGLSADEVRGALRSLQERGLVSWTVDGPARAVAASPAAVDAMISNRLRELHAAQEALDRITAQYRANHLAGEATGVFEVVRGHDALRQRTLHLVHTARFEALNMIKPPIVALHSEDRVAPGDTVRGRVVFETEALGSTGALAALQQGLRSQDEVRVHTKLPVKMLAVDRSVALLPLSQSDTTPLGVLVHRSAILDAFLALFEYVWSAAIPLHVDNANSPAPAAPSALSADDRRLLSMLLAGLTDEAIAAHRGVSVRTVQRRVQALMAVAKVRTRMQLAWEAARKGWV